MTMPDLGYRYVSGTPENPAHVPDPAGVDVRWRWYVGHPSTIHQRASIQRRLDRIGISEADLSALMGAGFRDVRSLSKWAASWLISRLNEFEFTATEEQVKAAMGRILRDKHPHLQARIEGEIA